MTSLHQPAVLTSACWRGPRTHARATTNFLEIKAADGLSGAGPPRHSDSNNNSTVNNNNKKSYVTFTEVIGNY